MSFFYDLNKKLDSIRATPALTHQQLNERDLGKHNNATTGFAALAKKTGGGEKGARIAGAQLAKMRAKGQVEEGSPYTDYTPVDEPVNKNAKAEAPGSRIKVDPPAPPASAASRAAPPTKKTTNEADMDESAFQAAIGKKKYGDQGMKALQKAGRNHASDTTMNNIRNRYDKYDESMGMADEGNAFSGAVVRAKADGVQPGEKIHVGGKEYPVKEAAKWRAPEHKDKLYTQKPGDSDDYDDMDYGYDDYGIKARPKNDPGQKRRMGGVGDKFSRTDPLEKGFGRSGTGSPVEKGPRKGLPKRDQITSLKGSIKDARGTHAEPNLPEAGVPMTAKQKSFAKLAPPANKITFADKIAGAKKEVDEMLGQVAADAMKNALGGGRGRNAEMDEGHFDDTPTRRRSSSGGEIDTSKPGSTVHRAVKGNYSGAAHSGEERRANRQADADDEQGPRAGRRTVGAGKGTKIGAKINRGTSKLMTREGDQDPADQGEYGREGESSRNNIHTMMRNAKQLEKMLGNEDNLPEWVQEKLTLASDYMQTIADYLASERETDAEDETGMELAEKKSVRSKPKQSNGNDGNLANNAKPYDKVTRGDVVSGRLGKDEMGGKKKSTKPSAKKEEEVDESTTAGSVATAPTASKASKGSMSFGKGIYDSINRAVETQINESMNISMNMSTDEHGGPGQTLTITATDEDASQLALLLKMAGMGSGGDDMSHGAASSGGEVCAGCGMSDCGCGDMEQMDETYGDNVVSMNSPNYPTNTESAQDNFGYSGGLNKEKNYYSSNGQTTVPVTAVHGQKDDFQESIQRMREIAGIKETPSIFFPDPKDTAKQLGIKAQSRLIDTQPPMSTGSNRSYNNTFLDPAQKAQNRLARQNESIFTDTANLWKSYKG